MDSSKWIALIGLILGILFILILVLGIDFLITAGLVWIICWAFGWQFSWPIAIGIFAITILLGGIRIKIKTDD